MGVVVTAATDLGLKRSQNEDSHGSWIPPEPDECRRRGVLLVIADGMGGSRAGEVASRLAVQTVLRAYREAGGSDPLEDLFRAVESANRVVHHESLAHPEMAGMGTTCTAVVVRGPDAYLAHVGDSRAYLLQDGRMRQLTRDHSLVAQLVRDGQLTPEQARADPRRNVVTRSVGVGAHVEIDAEHEPGRLKSGDTLLLCTDGLHGLVSDEELKVAAAAADMERGCREVIALANQRGGPDNITVLLARVAGEAEAAGGLRAAAASPERAPLEPPRSGPADADESRRHAAEEHGSRQGRADAERSRFAPADDPYAATEPDVHQEPRPAGSVAEAPLPYARREERRGSSSAVLLWLIIALTVLVVAAMAIVLHRKGTESKRLGAAPAEVRLA